MLRSRWSQQITMTLELRGRIGAEPSGRFSGLRSVSRANRREREWGPRARCIIHERAAVSAGYNQFWLQPGTLAARSTLRYSQKSEQLPSEPTGQGGPRQKWTGTENRSAVNQEKVPLISAIKIKTKLFIFAFAPTVILLRFQRNQCPLDDCIIVWM